MNVAGRSGLVRIKIAMGINPEHAYILMYTGNAADRAKRNAMIASEDEREFIVPEVLRLRY